MFTLHGTEYSVEPAKFKKFVLLEELHDLIGTSQDQADLICQYVALALDIDKEICLKEPWKSIALAYVAILTANLFSLQLPFLKTKHTDSEKMPWEYQGRTWHSYAHIFAKEYGWKMEYIAELSVEDAMKMLQEILIESQLRREWEWDLSEKSTGYDPDSKKSKHIDLPRPDWMIKMPEPPKRYKMLRSMLPMGVILKPDGSVSNDYA